MHSVTLFKLLIETELDLETLKLKHSNSEQLTAPSHYEGGKRIMKA